MSRYIRAHYGSLYFFTVVTHRRRPWLTTPEARRDLREAFARVRTDHPFHVRAIVLLPDHLHTIWELPRGDADYSVRWRWIKTEFTKRWAAGNDNVATTNPSRLLRGEHDIWQRRFYEHTIVDQNDYKHCVDYIHFNPLKHGFVSRVRDWPWSSFHRYVSEGEYSHNWGSLDVLRSGDYERFE